MTSSPSPLPQPKDVLVKPGAWYPEEETTDTGSCASDAESTCSSASTSRLSWSDAGSRACVQVPAAKGGRQRIALPGHLSLGRSGRCSLGKSGRFGGTPLETIPGSPNKAAARRQMPLLTTAPPEGPGRIVAPMAAAEPAAPSMPTPVLAYGPPQCLRSPRKSLSSPLSFFLSRQWTRKRARTAAEVQAALATGALPPTTCTALPHKGLPVSGQAEPKAVLAYTPARPSSPKKRARAELLAQVPLKVTLPEAVAVLPHTTLDPRLPAKKVPSYAEFAGGTEAALRGMMPGMPVKKRVPAFLLRDPPRVVTPPREMPR